MRRLLTPLLMLFTGAVSANPLTDPVGEAITARVNQYWTLPPTVLPAKPIMATLTLKPDLTIDRISITQSSGDALIDNSLLRALKLATPLPVPVGQYINYQQFEMLFDPNAVSPLTASSALPK